jgi:methyltransferase-like protein/2-polyprenyl-3-methyl-5-hydroxy-6-metoxy-1,4-benzoquinol methylase
MQDPLTNSYDDLPYESPFIAESHPDRLAAMAVLHGLMPPPVARCRVLDLGCANGGNVLPMAQSLPGARFTGIDLSPRQVAEGQALAEKLGFSNVELKTMDLMEVDDAFGQFDYIICHGVFSWVPAAVRDKILAICARNLSPGGVAYVSYNTYPGWHLRGMVREMLLHRGRAFADRRTRVREARAFLDFLTRSAIPQDSPYVQALKHEAGLIEKSRDTYLFHEHLEDENHPLYFRDFASLAAQAGLQYLGPARFAIHDAQLGTEAKQALDQLGTNRIEREQFLDFFVNRTFRQSLLCHSGLVATASPSPEAIRHLRITALARPELPTSDVRSEVPESFLSVFGDRLTVSRPLLKAALVALQRRWPRSANLNDLWSEACSLLGRDDGDPQALARLLLQAHVVNLVDFNTDDPPIAPEAGEQPRAGALARYQAASDARVINLRLRPAALDPFDRLILPLLDGTRNREVIVEELARSAAEGVLHIEHEGHPVVDSQQVRGVLAESLESSLQRMAGEALLLSGAGSP